MKKKVALVLPFLQKAKWISDPPPCDTSERLKQILAAAGDRIKVAGDILQFDELFVADDQLAFDEAVFDKRLKNDPTAVSLVKDFREVLTNASDFRSTVLEGLLKEFLEARGLKFGQIAAALRVAISGKASGLGLFDYCEILGRESTLRRIDRALSLAQNT